jgi:hypothetical protein
MRRRCYLKSRVHVRLVVLRSASIALIACAACAACSSRSSHGRFDGNVYRNGAVAFALPDPPSGWRRIDVSTASLAFRDDEHEASVLLNARCLTADDRTPLLALTNHLLMGATEREFVRQTKEPFDGREAMHTRLTAKWDGVPMLVDMFVLSKDGCVYDFVYLERARAAPTPGEPPERETNGAAAFEQFVHGFRTLRGSGVV